MTGLSYFDTINLQLDILCNNRMACMPSRLPNVCNFMINYLDETNDNNCLITALENAGIETTAVEQYVKNQFIPQKYLKQIAGGY